jgi:Mrp family chromosome partitioning ATPase
MDEICASLVAEHANRMIIFDSSPLLLTTESAVLASKVGQIAVVVRANSTPTQAVFAALEKLDSSKPIGCILNQVYRADLAADYGNYGDYGDYGFRD